MDDFEDVPFTLGSIRIRNRSDHSIKSTLFPVSYRPVDAKSSPAESVQVLESSLTTCDVEGCIRNDEEKLVSETEGSDEVTNERNDIQIDELHRDSFSPSARKQHASVEAPDSAAPIAPVIQVSETATGDCECINVANKAVEDLTCNKEIHSAATVTTTSTSTIPDNSIEQSTVVVEGSATDATIVEVQISQTVTDVCECIDLVNKVLVEDPTCNKEIHSAATVTTTSTSTIPDNSIEQSTVVVEGSATDATIVEGPTQQIERMESHSDGSEIHTIVGESAPGNSLVQAFAPSCRVESETQPSCSPWQICRSPMLGTSSPVFQSSIVLGPAVQSISTHIPLLLEYSHSR